MVVAYRARVVVFVQEAVAVVIARVCTHLLPPVNLEVAVNVGSLWNSKTGSTSMFKTGSPVMGCTKPSGRMPLMSTMTTILTLHLLVGTAGS